MIKVNYNGGFIELEDELEKGAMELDLLKTNDEENTIELNGLVKKTKNATQKSC